MKHTIVWLNKTGLQQHFLGKNKIKVISILCLRYIIHQKESIYGTTYQIYATYTYLQLSWDFPAYVLVLHTNTHILSQGYIIFKKLSCVFGLSTLSPNFLQKMWVYINISSVVEFQRWWVLKSKILQFGDQVSRISFDFLKWRSTGPQKLTKMSF